MASHIVNQNFHVPVVSYGVLPDTVIVEKLCERFRLAADACTKTKREFANRVGLSSSQLSNLGNNRNPPPHTAIYSENSSVNLLKSPEKPISAMRLRTPRFARTFAMRLRAR